MFPFRRAAGLAADTKAPVLAARPEVEGLAGDRALGFNRADPTQLFNMDIRFGCHWCGTASFIWNAAPQSLQRQAVRDVAVSCNVRVRQRFRRTAG